MGPDYARWAPRRWMRMAARLLPVLRPARQGRVKRGAGLKRYRKAARVARMLSSHRARASSAASTVAAAIASNPSAIH
jgi:hypothetical protein